MQGGTEKYRRNLSLSITPASDSDGGLYLREAYMNGSFMPAAAIAYPMIALPLIASFTAVVSGKTVMPKTGQAVILPYRV